MDTLLYLGRCFGLGLGAYLLARLTFQYLCGKSVAEPREGQVYISQNNGEKVVIAEVRKSMSGDISIAVRAGPGLSAAETGKFPIPAMAQDVYCWRDYVRFNRLVLMPQEIVPRKYYDQECFRVYPDRAVEDYDEPLVRKGFERDYCWVWAYSEAEARRLAEWHMSAGWWV